VQNIEIKTPLRDFAKIEARLVALGARKIWTARQTDTFFDVPARSGWLKLRESEGRPPEVISYERSTGHAGPRPSHYDVLVVKDPEAWKSLLSRVLPILGIVRKERTLWIYEHTRIHIDRVEGLGDFLELETVVDDIPQEEAHTETKRIVDALDLDPAEFVALPYMELLRRT